jgi:16S rRNA (cytosine1402-N4)-methyltransferase
VIGLDRDKQAIAGAARLLASHGDRFTARQSPFSLFGGVLDELGLESVDGICMDLGLSSDQLDDPGRGFAFRLDGPLDLRFDTTQGQPAAERIALATEAELLSWLSKLGEVRRARRIARVLHARAEAGELKTTGEVREAVVSVHPKSERVEPELARVFQALRILVNDELGQLDKALSQLPDRLNSGGRFVAVSYHSLEDRRVKRMLQLESRGASGSRHLPAAQPFEPRMRTLTRKPVLPSDQEIASNPRSRSAKLRAGERL